MDTTRQPSIAAGIVRGLVEFAVRKGADRSELLRQSGLEEQQLADREARVPLVDYRRVVASACELTNRPGLALQFGVEVDLSELSVVALAARFSKTPQEGADVLNRYSSVLVDPGADGASDRVSLRQGRRGLWIELLAHPSVDYPEFTETSLARMAGGFAKVYGDQPFAKEVHVTHRAPPYAEDYEKIFRAPTVFDSDRNAILVGGDLLTLRLPFANSLASEVLRERADLLLDRLEASDTARGRVESVLLRKLETGGVGMTEVAQELGVSRATLYRQLRAEEVSFQEVRQALRERLALTYLSEGRSVQETARLLGYSEASAFSRAFKRWTGASPRESQAEQGSAD